MGGAGLRPATRPLFFLLALSMYIQMISVHGLVRGHDIEMGRDADTGGQVRYVVELMRALSQHPAVTKIDLFTRLVRDKRVSSDYAEPVESINDKARVIRIPCGGGRYIRKEKLWPHLDDFCDGMISFARREGLTPDVIHGHYADAGYIGKEVASTFGVPFIFTGHSLGRDKLEFLIDKGLTREAANRDYNIDHRIAVEEDCLAIAELVVTSTRHEFEHQYGKYNNGSQPRFEIIPPGLDLERLFPYYEYKLNPERVEEPFRQARVRMLDELGRFHFHADKPLILALCRPDKRKNIGALVEAYGQSPELKALANLAIFAGLRRSIADMGEDEQAVLTAMLLLMDKYDLYGKMAIPKRHDPTNDVPELYRIAASSHGVFVNAAFVEPFGLTFIEASATGLPFVGTRNGGPQDIVANCNSGLIVDVADIDEMTTAIKKLLTDRATWDECSRDGINKVREHYSWDAHCTKYVESIEAIAGKRGKRVHVAGSGDISLASRFKQLDAFLITDIDNTLLGDEAALRELRDVIHANRDRLGFGVASGRYLEKAREVLSDNGIEILDVIISSVGAEIYYGPECIPDRGWASHLRARWRPERVHETLDALPFLTLQPDKATQREFKISYDLDSSVSPEEAMPKIHEALNRARVAYRLIFSHGVFLDILPYRASKGKAIRYLANKWSLPIQRIATAGDSGNDTDMLLGNTAGIVVANHDSELAELRERQGRIYFAEGRNAAGILEGMRHYGFID
jgi:sucrose-phosphate synthase